MVFKKGHKTWNKGKKISDWIDYNTNIQRKRKISIAVSGKNNPNYGKKHPGMNKGNKRPDLSEYNRKFKPLQTGNKNGRWIDGRSFEPYPKEWTRKLREKIRKRDGYYCQFCTLQEKDNNQKLDVHHIDYNKQNCNETNLISLCRKCHAKTFRDKDYWIWMFYVWLNYKYNYFQNEHKIIVR